MPGTGELDTRRVWDFLKPYFHKRPVSAFGSGGSAYFLNGKRLTATDLRYLHSLRNKRFGATRISKVDELIVRYDLPSNDFDELRIR